MTEAADSKKPYGLYSEEAIYLTALAQHIEQQLENPAAAQEQ